MTYRTRAFIVLSVGLLFIMAGCLAFTPSVAASARATVPPTNTPRHAEIALIPTLAPRPCPPSAQYSFVDGEGQLYLVTIKAVCGQ